MICMECDGEGFVWRDRGGGDVEKEMCGACEGEGTLSCPECDDEDPHCEHCAGYKELE